jgi:hypothetical protein
VKGDAVKKIKLVRQDKHYAPKIGDLCWGNPEVGQYLVGYSRALLKGKTFLQTGLFSLNPWEALPLMGIHAYPLKIRYECPITELEFWAVVPAGVAAVDLETYRERLEQVDSSWKGNVEKGWIERMHSYLPEDVTPIKRAMLGTGYTDCCHPSDGHGSIVELMAPLNNGDILLLFLWEWYNK